MPQHKPPAPLVELPEQSIAGLAGT